MGYPTLDEIRDFCGLTEAECPDTEAQAALDYAKGLIEEYCRCPFEAPASDSVYYYDGDGTRYLFSPPSGPFGSVTSVEYYDGSDWVDYDGDYYVQQNGEWIELDSPTSTGTQNWRVTGKLYRTLTDNQGALLKRAALMLSRLALVPRDEPIGPSVRSISMEGLSYVYQAVDPGHPTGVNEIDHILRTLRRRVVHV